MPSWSERNATLPHSRPRSSGGPRPHPHRVLDVPVEVLVEPDELAVALPVDPQLARGAAPVPLPMGRVAAAGGQQHGVRARGDVADRPVGQGLGGSAVERHGACPGTAQAGLAVRAQGEDPAVRGPAADLGPHAAPVGEPPGAAAVDGGDVHLGGAVAGGGPRDGGAVRGDPWMVHRHVVRADPPGAAAVERGDPYVVLGGEGDQLAVQVRETEVCAGCDRCRLCHPITLWARVRSGQRFRITCPRRGDRTGTGRTTPSW